MKTVKLINNYVNVAYIQEPQDSKVTFSIAKKIDNSNYSLEYTPFRCKDYFNEIIASRYFGYIYTKVYGFEAKEVHNDKEFFLVYSSTSLTERKNFLSNLKVLKEVEEIMGIPISRRSKILKADDNKSFIIRVPKEWLSSSILMSFYTLLLRSFAYITSSDTFDLHMHRMSSLGNNDSRMFKEISTSTNFNIYTLLKGYKRIFKVNPVTGYDDNLLRTRLKDIDEGGSCNISRRDGLQNKFYWNYHAIHHFGLIAFIRAISLISYHSIGLDWINAYRDLNNE